jgi:hypothetical protein
LLVRVRGIHKEGHVSPVPFGVRAGGGMGRRWSDMLLGMGVGEMGMGVLVNHMGPGFGSRGVMLGDECRLRSSCL